MSHIAGGFFTSEPPGKPQEGLENTPKRRCGIWDKREDHDLYLSKAVLHEKVVLRMAQLDLEWMVNGAKERI